MKKIFDHKVDSMLSQDSDATKFFYEKITVAQEKQRIKLSENVEFYLVNLLCEYVRLTDKNTLNDCLALILKKALESSHGEKIILYKKIADNALYFSGFFQEFFNNKSYDIKYYVTMGESAYGELSHLMRGKATYQNTMAQIYKEMSANFHPAVDILLQVSEETQHKSTVRSTLSIYDAWLNTESQKLEKELLGRGVFPIKTSLRKIQ